MSPSLGPVTRTPQTNHPDLHAPQATVGPGGTPPAAPAAPKPPAPTSVLNAQAHPLEHRNDSPSAAMLRGRQGQAAPAGAGQTPGAWPRPLNVAAPAALAPAGPADDAKLAAIPREQMKREVEEAQAAFARAKTPEEQAVARAKLGAANARAESWSRAAIKQAALKYAGAGATRSPDRYLEVLAGPGDTKETRAAMLKQSTCALFARGVWRQAGVADTRLEKNYRTQHAVSDVVDIARARGAWVDVSRGAKGKLPQKGDVLLIDDSPHKINPKTGLPQGREHVIVVVGDPRPDPKDPNKMLVDTVEGGQGSGGVDSLAFGAPENGGKNNPKTIRIDRGNGTLWVGSRKVVGWADGAKVASPTAPHTGDELEKKAAPKKAAGK